MWFLIGGGAGALAAALLGWVVVTHFDRGAGAPGPGLLSVRDLGARGDGNTDDTAAIQAAIDRARVPHAGPVFLPGGVYRTTAPLRLYPGVRVIGVNSGEAVIGTQIRAYHDGNVFEFDRTFGAPWFHHGGIEKMSIKAGIGFRPAAGIDIYQAGENCILQELSLEDLADGIVLGDDAAETYQVSATIRNVSGQRNAGAVIRIRRGIMGGMINVDSLSADANGHVLQVDGSGASFSVLINGLKSEAPEPGQHAPAILIADSTLNLSIYGGWVTTGAKTGTQDVIGIAGAGSAPRIVMQGVGVLNYVNLVNDTAQDRKIAARLGATPRTFVAYNVTGLCETSGLDRGGGCAGLRAAGP